MKTAKEILRMPVSKQTVYLDTLQRKILKEHFGSKKKADDYRLGVMALFPLADKFASECDLSKIKVNDWQKISITGLDYVPDLRSIAFHQEMDRLKKERLHGIRDNL